jgi:integrase/recombinase XerC
MSIEDFEKYLTSERKYALHTVNAYVHDLSDFINYIQIEYGVADLKEVEYPIIRSWLIGLMEAGLSSKTINRKTASLKAFYAFLQRKGVVQSHPLSGHKPLKMPHSIEVPLSEQEMMRLIQNFPTPNTYEDLRDQIMIELLYSTGIRRAELISLLVFNVNLEQRWIKVIGKRNKERIIPLLDALIPRLQSFLSMRRKAFENPISDYLFLTNSGNKIYDSLVYRTINRYLREVSGKTKKSPHILRHTFATHLLNNGADINSVKELLGHSTLASTQVYTHNSIAELRRIHEGAHPRNLEE